MNKHTDLQDRADMYRDKFPKFEALNYIARPAGVDRLEGLWDMGNNYRTSGLYGAYPHGYLPRVMSMFPDAERVLHVPSGSIPPGPYLRIDIRPEAGADITGDAHDLPALVGDRTFDLIMGDIPYSVEDAEHYGRPMVRRQAFFESCLSVLEPGGFLVWLDQVRPMWRKAEIDYVIGIGIFKSSNHRVRGMWTFQKKVAAA